MQTNRSAWTPLNHPPTNIKVFEERRQLVAKWFDRWSDSQRKAVLQDFVLSCSVEQLRFLSISVSRQLPLQAADFTCLLPRALCLYIFSFLDPRSLCRCAQVSWHWKSIVELDQLWMPKCLRLGWCITFSTSPFEQGAWKRHYIQTVKELQQTGSSQPQPMVPGAAALNIEAPKSAHVSKESPVPTAQPPGVRSGSRLKKERPVNAPRPWRDSDKHPKDTICFNYLDNVEPIEQLLRTKTKSRSSAGSSSSFKMDDRRRKTQSEASHNLHTAKSHMFLSSNHRCQLLPPPPPPDPHQTQIHHQSSHTQDPLILPEEIPKNLLTLARWNAGIRPRPVRTLLPRLSLEALRASQRSHRSPPSAPLFTV